MEYLIYKCDRCEEEIRIKRQGESMPDGWVKMEISVNTTGHQYTTNREYLLCPVHGGKAGITKEELSKPVYDETLADKLINVIQEIVLETSLS